MGISHPLKFGVVGPCTSGKSSLVRELARSGIHLHHIAQEHSFVADMWKRITNPDRLIFLDVSYVVSLQRRDINWTVEEYQEQQRRLRHARENADLFIMTDDFSITEVAEKVLKFIQSQTLSQDS